MDVCLKFMLHLTNWTIMHFAAMQILLAMTVYQIIISGKLPSTSSSVPIIGQFTAVETNYMYKIRISRLTMRRKKYSVVLAHQAGMPACLYDLLLLLSSFFIFNDRLKQRDVRNY